MDIVLSPKDRLISPKSWTKHRYEPLQQLNPMVAPRRPPGNALACTCGVRLEENSAYHAMEEDGMSELVLRHAVAEGGCADGG